MTTKDEVKAMVADCPAMEWTFYSSVEDFPKEPRPGTIAISWSPSGHETYCYLANQWTNCGSMSAEEEDEKEEFEIIGTNCPNCGAVVNKHTEECEYCGTPYVKMRVR